MLSAEILYENETRRTMRSCFFIRGNSTVGVNVERGFLILLSDVSLSTSAIARTRREMSEENDSISFRHEIIGEWITQC